MYYEMKFSENQNCWFRYIDVMKAGRAKDEY